MCSVIIAFPGHTLLLFQKDIDGRGRLARKMQQTRTWTKNINDGYTLEGRVLQSVGEIKQQLQLPRILDGIHMLAIFAPWLPYGKLMYRIQNTNFIYCRKA